MPRLENLSIVLVRPAFPENIGMAARASANFGSVSIRLVSPVRWIYEKALPTATSQGVPILNSIMVYDDLLSAVSEDSLVIGTTARTGGARQQLIYPKDAAKEAVKYLLEGERVSILFGPEDRGLSNEDLKVCNRLVTIPTSPNAKSLNLAQAVLLLLYECSQSLENFQHIELHTNLSRRLNTEERKLFFDSFCQSLINLGTIPPDNAAHFFQPLARFFDRAEVRRHEMDIFMGICRQIDRLAGINDGISKQNN